MNGRGFITISMHELERVKIIEAVVQHRLTVVLAAERLLLPRHAQPVLTAGILVDVAKHCPDQFTGPQAGCKTEIEQKTEPLGGGCGPATRPFKFVGDRPNQQPFAFRECA